MGQRPQQKETMGGELIFDFISLFCPQRGSYRNCVQFILVSILHHIPVQTHFIMI